jgi:hypothetical protein
VKQNHLAMLKLTDLKQGDAVSINDQGIQRVGTVVKVSPENHQALIDNGIQEFWFGPEEMTAIPLDEEQLMRMGFTKESMDGGTKYKKDSFRLVTPRQGDFSNIDMWWREDKRHFNFPLGVHELQNLHLSMTKVQLQMH